MKLKRLDIIGFKSFVDRTSIVFPPGITAIVGPNGSGKSNIVDAIRWVLGEQGHKILRGRTMEDVIFNGSEKRKPLGMAEVTLTLLTEDGRTPRDYAEFSEISVRRRLYRSGESEYSINNTPCRLKDITELFLDTGVGTRSYSIIDQGRIEWLLTAQPEERRLLIEEVAGIHKYRVRKDATLKKLDATNQNLLRIKDIIHEVKRQINSLNRHAKKAARFKAIRDEMREIEIYLMAEELKSLIDEKEGLEARLEGLNKDELEITTSIKGKEAEEERIRLVLLDREKEIEALSQGLHSLEEDVKNKEKELEINELKSNTLKVNIERMKRECDELEEKKGSIEERIGRGREEKEALGLSISKIEEDIQLLGKSLEETIEICSPISKILEDNKREMVDRITALARIKNSQSKFEEERDRLSREMVKRTEERRGVIARIETLEAELKEISLRIDQTNGEKTSLLKEIDALNTRLEGLREDRSIKEQDIEGIKRELTEVSTRLQALKESDGSNSAGMLLSKSLNASKKVDKKGIHGLVADIFQADAHLERALEAVLGERLNTVIVDSHKEGLEAISYLKQGNKGRGSFLPVKTGKRGERLRLEGVFTSSSDIEGPILDKVKVREGYDSVAESLLGDVVLVEDLDRALNIWMANGIDMTLVTLDGDMIDADGVLTGGSFHELDRGLLKKRREIDELSKREEALKKREKELSEELNTIEAEIEGITARIEGLNSEAHKKEIESVTLDGRLKASDGEIRSLKRRLEIISIEEDEIKNNLEALEDEYTKSIDDRKRLEDDIEEIKKKTEKEEEQYREMLLKKEEIDRRITERKVELASLKKSYENITSNIEDYSHELGAVNRKIEERIEGIKEAEEEKKRLLNSMEHGKATLFELMKEVDALKEERAVLEEGYSQIEIELKGVLDGLKKDRKRLDEIKEDLSNHMIELKGIELKINNLLERANERHGIDGDGLLSSMDGFHCDGDPKERLNLLRQKLQSMGEVNLSSIGELKELEERYSFLTTQQEDIERSIASLKRAIHRINAVSRKRLLNTFDEVNKRFKEVCSYFFEGGRAELRLHEPENPLESGIDIFAQPKGKRLQSITLLSGGEKALLVIALIFSLFLVKPSPFFLLDEIDAALDDSNIIRFRDFIKGLSSDSQLIIVTHNKNTMEIADTLYGITMTEPGVSSILSVNLKEAV